MKTRGRPRAFDQAQALQKAMELFWRKGYEGTSLTDLTKALGINPPSLYAAFGSKEQLYRDSVDLYARTVNTSFHQSIQEAPTAREAFKTALFNTVEAMTTKKGPRGCLIARGVDNSPENENLRAHLARYEKNSVATFEKRLRKAIAEKEIKSTANVSELALYFFTVSQGLATQARSGVSEKALKGVVRCALAAWDGMTRQ